MQLNITQFSILSIINHNTSQDKSYYSKISVNKIRKLLEIYHKIYVGRCWIFRCIKRLIKKGYLTRHPRYKPMSDGLYRRMSSMLSFTKRGCKFLLYKGVFSVKKIMRRWYQKPPDKDMRKPNEEDFYQSNNQEIISKQQKELKHMLGIVTKDIN